MKRVFIIRYIFMAISIGLMTLIFWFSSQNGEKSSGVSGSFATVLSEFLQPVFPQNVVDFIVEYIRKAAHVFLYACLGASVSIFVFTFPCRHGWAYFAVPLFICFLYACSDEIHQFFVEGRDGKFTDVLVDAVGFALATAAANLIRCAVIQIQNRKKKKQKDCNG